MSWPQAKPAMLQIAPDLGRARGRQQRRQRSGCSVQAAAAAASKGLQQWCAPGALLVRSCNATARVNCTADDSPGRFGPVKACSVLRASLYLNVTQRCLLVGDFHHQDANVSP